MPEGSAKSPLCAHVAEEFVRYLQHLAGRVERAVRSVPVDKVYTKPFAFGNSLGHLVLHLTGNLNHYIGAKIAGTGYVRDRPHEFTDASPPPPDVALERFREAVALVVRTIRSLDDAGWQVPVQEEQPIQTRFGLVLVCVSHMNNHIGQMSYLVQALGHSTNEPPIW
jgi:uncharacterized damage-inducible protein DinB